VASASVAPDRPTSSDRHAATPVFVDPAGRRRRWTTWIGRGIGAACATYLVAAVASTMGVAGVPRAHLPTPSVPDVSLPAAVTFAPPTSAAARVPTHAAVTASRPPTTAPHPTTSRPPAARPPRTTTVRPTRTKAPR
jgi:hypothetical protein